MLVVVVPGELVVGGDVSLVWTVVFLFFGHSHATWPCSQHLKQCPSLASCAHSSVWVIWRGLHWQCQCPWGQCQSLMKSCWNVVESGWCRSSQSHVGTVDCCCIVGSWGVQCYTSPLPWQLWCVLWLFTHPWCMVLCLNRGLYCVSFYLGYFRIYWWSPPWLGPSPSVAGSSSRHFFDKLNKIAKNLKIFMEIDLIKYYHLIFFS